MHEEIQIIIHATRPDRMDRMAEGENMLGTYRCQDLVRIITINKID